MAATDRIVLRYRNRAIGERELELIRALTRAEAHSRQGIAEAICKAWDWRQPDGNYSIYACRDLLLRLSERGLLELPAFRRARQRADLPVLPKDHIALAWIPLGEADVALRSVVVRPIEKEERAGWRLFMDRYHYLGDTPLVGEHLQYAAFAGDELVALIGWAAAAFRVPTREQFIGWDEQTKRKRLHLIANNVRFLIPPWVKVKNLASKVLSLNLQRLSGDWQRRWNHPVHLAETFVDRSRFAGTCYRAANWRFLGMTAGRSKRGNRYVQGASAKAVFVYELHRNARVLLGGSRVGEPCRLGECRR